jgi:curved DNA-binding protein CbpA
MKSAYAVLGLPGNASNTDIDEALSRATAHYSRERLAADPSLMDKLAEIRDAHKLLSNAEMRSAHDRKLSASAGTPPAAPNRRPVVAMEAASPPWYTRPMVLLALTVVVMFAIGSYMTNKRDQQRKEIAALELAKKKIEADEAARAEAEQSRKDAMRANADAQAQARERQLRNEGTYAANRAASDDRQLQSQMSRQADNDRREAERKEQQAKADERQRVADARRAVMADQARLREICMRRYQTPNC